MKRRSGNGDMTQYMSTESIPWKDQVSNVKSIIDKYQLA